MITLELNGRTQQIDAPDDMPLLWVLREKLALTGTKFGCGLGQCGACTVHVDGDAARACLTPIGSLQGKRVTTIEGLSPQGDHPLQRAWIAHNVPQCGYCQAGQLMSAAALLSSTPNPTPQQVRDGMSGNLCRCGTYPRIEAAILSVASQQN